VQQDQLILENDNAVSKLTEENRHLKMELEADRNKVKKEKESFKDANARLRQRLANKDKAHKSLQDLNSKLEKTKDEAVQRSLRYTRDYEKKDKIRVKQQWSILEHDKAVSKMLTYENRNLKEELKVERNKVKVNSEIDFKTQFEKANTDLKDSKVKEAEIAKLKAEIVKQKAEIVKLKAKLENMKSESSLVQASVKKDKERLEGDLKKALDAKLDQITKHESKIKSQDHELVKAKSDKVKLNMANNESIKTLETKEVEIEALKTELQKTVRNYP
jgi:chromosome segregation ATPase